MEITAISSVLSKSEIDKFGKFINSPFFNTEQRFINLYDLIKSEGTKLTREYIADKIFKGKVSVSDSSFRKLISEFIKLFERFLSELEISEDSFNLKFAYMKQLDKRGLNDSYHREVNKIEAIINSNKIKDEDFYSKMLELYSYRYNKEGFNFNSWKDDLSFSLNDLIDKYFISSKLHLMQRFISIEYIFMPDDNIETVFQESINKYIQDNKNVLKENDPVIYLRHLMYRMISNPEDKILLNEYLSFLGILEKNTNINYKIYYEDLINYYSLLINLGREEFEQNIIFVARIMDERGYFRSGIMPNDFKIICEASIGSEDCRWGEEFAERNKSFIIDKYRESIYALCVAKIYFFKKDYSKSRHFISLISYDDFMRYAESKLIESRILYEEKRIPELLAVIETTQKYLKSNKEIGAHFKETYSSFLSCLKNLNVLSEKKQVSKDIRYELNVLEREISKRQSQLYGKIWLNEQIETLKRQV